jgi:hypothetical protein
MADLMNVGCNCCGGSCDLRCTPTDPDTHEDTDSYESITIDSTSTTPLVQDLKGTYAIGTNAPYRLQDLPGLFGVCTYPANVFGDGETLGIQLHPNSKRFCVECFVKHRTDYDRGYTVLRRIPQSAGALSLEYESSSTFNVRASQNSSTTESMRILTRYAVIFQHLTFCTTVLSPRVKETLSGEPFSSVYTLPNGNGVSGSLDCNEGTDALTDSRYNTLFGESGFGIGSDASAFNSHFFPWEFAPSPGGCKFAATVFQEYNGAGKVGGKRRQFVARKRLALVTLQTPIVIYRQWWAAGANASVGGWPKRYTHTAHTNTFARKPDGSVVAVRKDGDGYYVSQPTQILSGQFFTNVYFTPLDSVFMGGGGHADLSGLWGTADVADLASMSNKITDYLDNVTNVGAVDLRTIPPYARPHRVFNKSWYVSWAATSNYSDCESLTNPMELQSSGGTPTNEFRTSARSSSPSLEATEQADGTFTLELGMDPVSNISHPNNPPSDTPLTVTINRG